MMIELIRQELQATLALAQEAVDFARKLAEQCEELKTQVRTLLDAWDNCAVVIQTASGEAVHQAVNDLRELV